MMSISTTLFGEISHASLFFTGQLRNPWQMLAAEFRGTLGFRGTPVENHWPTDVSSNDSAMGHHLATGWGLLLILLATSALPSSSYLFTYLLSRLNIEHVEELNILCAPYRLDIHWISTASWRSFQVYPVMILVNANYNVIIFRNLNFVNYELFTAAVWA